MKNLIGKTFVETNEKGNQRIINVQGYRITLCREIVVGHIVGQTPYSFEMDIERFNARIMDGRIKKIS